MIARELSQSGFSVVVMEQGPRFAPTDFEHDEFKYWMRNGITNDPAVGVQSYRKTPKDEAKQRVGFPSAWYARMVGGSSNHFTANFWRFHENDFHERSLLGAISGTGFEDWPISYADLEPYYTKVDWEVGVSGLAGASPFDPPRSKPYPMPPMPVKSSGVLMERGARKLGLHPFPAPLAINSINYRGRPACIHCGFCMGFGCEAQAKASSLYTMIPEAEADRPLRGSREQLCLSCRHRQGWPTPIRRPAISMRQSMSSSRRRGRSWSVRTAPRRRACC